MLIEFAEKTFACLVLRLGLAAIFIYHGLWRVSKMGTEWHPGHAWVQWALLVCGVLIAIGLLTRPAALASAIIIVIAGYLEGFLTWPPNTANSLLEYNFVLVVICLALTIQGAGPLAIDAMVGTVVSIGGGGGGGETRVSGPRKEKSGFLD